jgi:hypothetical protein
MPSRSGPKSLYKPDEEAWLDTAVNQYLTLVQDKPSDAPALKDEKTEEFLKCFQTQLVDPNRNMEKTAVTEIEKWRIVSSIQYRSSLCRELTMVASARQGTLQECETPKTPQTVSHHRRPG